MGEGIATRNKEAVLAKPSAEWLESQGLAVYAEVPSRGRNVDLVGANLAATPPVLVVVELKVSFTEHLLHQTWMSTFVADEAYACAPTSPTRLTVKAARSMGMGLLRCAQGGVSVILKAPPREIDTHWARRDMLKRLATHPKGHDGGRPCTAGEGPAHNVRALVEAYILANPGHGWSQIFENVPNHYLNAKSLAGVMSRRFRVTIS